MKCGQCGLEIKWKRNNGRWFCFNPDGTDHWDKCSQTQYARIKAEGVKYRKQDSKGRYEAGYRHHEYGDKAVERGGTIKTGKDYRPMKHMDGCRIPPWENCECQNGRTS